MPQGQVFLVVGHENWGKSRTLKAMTDGNVHAKEVRIGSKSFFIRRMSNDDRPEEWVQFVDTLDPTEKPHVILTVCPRKEALPVLRKLTESYDLFFWVIRHRHNEGIQITIEEEKSLRALGTVEVYDQRREASDRAAAFKQFIRAHLEPMKQTQAMSKDNL